MLKPLLVITAAALALVTSSANAAPQCEFHLRMTDFVLKKQLDTAFGDWVSEVSIQLWSAANPPSVVEQLAGKGWHFEVSDKQLGQPIQPQNGFDLIDITTREGLGSSSFIVRAYEPDGVLENETTILARKEVFVESFEKSYRPCQHPEFKRSADQSCLKLTVSNSKIAINVLVIRACTP